MEALLRKYDIINLCRFQLPRKIPPAHTSVPTKLIMMGAQVCPFVGPKPRILSNLTSFLADSQ
jgi:hypothetical protein